MVIAAVGNNIVFTGYPMTDLKTILETVSDVNQMGAQINLVGTMFRVALPKVSMPSSINLTNDGFLCRKSTAQGNLNEIRDTVSWYRRRVEGAYHDSLGFDMINE
ncbi:hypothetical protein RJT34_12791 [Clitoria ternatea]|uniref:Uncharacterized protein n=1 Tax=Clitoria ternatea TaxID=43366 RepID=A0AAN9JQZ3_CLITE